MQGIYDAKLRAIKTRRPDLPVMMVTAYGDDERRRLAGEYGAAEFITKPVDFDCLKIQLRDLSDGRGLTNPSAVSNGRFQTIPGVHVKVAFGASARVPAAKAERPLSVQLGDPRGDAGQRARRAESSRYRPCKQTAGFHPRRRAQDLRQPMLGA